MIDLFTTAADNSAALEEAFANAQEQRNPRDALRVNSFVAWLSVASRISINMRAHVLADLIAGNAYKNIRALDHLLPASSVSSKSNHKPMPFNALDVVSGAPSTEWKYKFEDEKAKPHFGPVLEDLPEEMIHRSPDGKDATLGLHSMVGILWEAMRLQAAQVKTLIERIEKLEKKK